MKRSVINVSMTLALGLGLTVALLWLLSGGLCAVQAQALMATSRTGEPALLQNRDLPKGPEADHPPGPHAIPLAGPSYPDKSLSTTRSELDAASRERVNQALFNLPLRFVANAGQTDPAVRFTVKGAGHTLFFTQEGVVFSAVQEVEDETVRSVVRLRFLEASPHPTVEGLSPLSGVANFFLGNDPAQWRVNVPTYGAVAYRDLYPGVDLIYHGSEGYLKSEFRLAPEADPAAIQMVYSGLEALYLGEDGALVLQTALGELIETAPLIYQKVDGVRQVIPGGYVLLPSDLIGFRNLSGPGADAYKVGFQVGAYDSTRPLVIDPALAYSTYLGGGDWDAGRSIAVDSDGNAYVTGYTHSSDFPTTTLTIQPSYGGGNYDAFVTQIISVSGIYTYGYSTYLGGGDDDYGNGIAVDSKGSAYVSGETRSSDFPTTTNAIQANYGGGIADAFVSKIISASGSYTLAYSSYLGGNDLDRGSDIVVDSAGEAYATGWTGSTNFPTTTNAIQIGWGGSADAFVTQIVNASGVYTYGYSSYLGGTLTDQGHGIAVDDGGNVHVTGVTYSSDFPTTTLAIQPGYGGGNSDAFVTRIISASGVYTYGYSTYLGGGGDDYGQAIVVDSDGNTYVAGYTRSSDFPTHNALQATHATSAASDAFVTKIISASGVYTYGYSSCLGGDGNDQAGDIAVDSVGNTYVTGETHSSSSGFPIRHAIQAGHGGSYDAFVTQIISASGSYAYGYSTYLGGSLDDRGYGITVDGDGNAYLTGFTFSTDFPTRDAVQTDQGTVDAFVAKIAAPADLALSKTVTPTGAVEAGQPVTYTLVYTNDGQVPATGVLITDVVPTSLISVTFTSSGAQITPTGSVSYTWQVEDLSPGEGGVITLTGIVSGSSGLTNRATITTTPGAYFADDNPDNNESVVQSSAGYPIYLPLIMRAYP
jgi:uncharacterized repeat protein (TIGR01451 family)